MWHRALAAATANSIHLAGPGKFFISGFNAKHLDLNLLHQYLHEMVKMSPLQSYVFEVVPESERNGVIGAAVSAAQSIDCPTDGGTLHSYFPCVSKFLLPALSAVRC